TDAETAFDLVFHDPFSPNKVPQFWTSDIFALFKKVLDQRNGRLLTYSAASAVRGGLIENGFHVYRTSNLGRKAGGTLASVSSLVISESNGSILPLRDEEVASLKTHKALPFRDGSLNADRIEVLKRREQEQNAWKLIQNI
ncbi:MAG: hypothetical protein K2Z81_17835, partial [Cyanobacteria bacterium]|nr:hypothetical protein [Cyanobacteriota bacterium]